LQRFGTTLCQYRKQQRLSQRALAARTHLHRTYIYDIERGKYNLSVLTLLRLAKALGIPSPWLLARLNPNDPLPPREAQAAETSTTPVLTPDDQAALLSLLGATIRQYRQHQHLTQPGLATKTDLTASYISQIEGGTRNITILTLLRLADALELSVNHLLAPLDTYQRSSLPLPE
jgi:transcriptional regulator with XRE-family HTH domain